MLRFPEIKSKVQSRNRSLHVFVYHVVELLNMGFLKLCHFEQEWSCLKGVRKPDNIQHLFSRTNKYTAGTETVASLQNKPTLSIEESSSLVMKIRM